MGIGKLLAAFLSILSFIFLISNFNACYTPSHEMEVWHIDSIHKSLENSKEMLIRVDTHSINEMYKIFKLNSTKLHKIDKNSLTREDKNIVQQYDSINDKFFQKYKPEFVEYSINLKHSLKKLDTLKHMLTNNLIPKSTFEEYFSMDRREAVALNKDVFSFYKYTNNWKNLFNKLDPKILNICLQKKK